VHGLCLLLILRMFSHDCILSSRPHFLMAMSFSLFPVFSLCSSSLFDALQSQFPSWTPAFPSPPLCPNSFGKLHPLPVPPHEVIFSAWILPYFHSPYTPTALSSSHPFPRWSKVNACHTIGDTFPLSTHYYSSPHPVAHFPYPDS